MEKQTEFSIEKENRVQRVPKRGAYDFETIHRVLDATLVATVSFVDGEQPCAIPMLFARKENSLFFHGATTSRLMKVLSSGCRLCVSVVMVDGLVMARSLFHHSMNYRSVVAFGQGKEIHDFDDKTQVIKIITDKVMPGRWNDARLPSDQEMKATSIVAVEIDSASAKIRDGGPIDDPADMELPFWAGTIDFETRASVSTDPESMIKNIPDYMNQYVSQINNA